MIPLERQRRILENARREGTVRTVELAREFAVTEETIRRDLDLLTRRGRLRRTHGGAVDPAALLAGMARTELSHAERGVRQLAEKQAIARAAVTFIGPGETILLDASSTALELASLLPSGLSLRLVTYSLAVAERLAAVEDVELVQLGGTFDRRGRRFSGILTEMGLRTLRIDRFFFSGGGFHPCQGVGEPNPDQARLKSLMLAQAAWSCAMLDHTKFGAKTDHFFAPIDSFHVLVTDAAGAGELRPFGKSPPFEWVAADAGQA
jgi:DeoR/GlpR family transcriptional regulator of sugar metabolism